MPDTLSDLFPLKTRRSNIPYYELIGGHGHSFGRDGDGRRVTRVCRVKEQFAALFLADMLGDLGVAQTKTGQYRLHRTVPDYYNRQTTTIFAGGGAIILADPSFAGERIYAHSMEYMLGLQPYQATPSRGGALQFREYVYQVAYAQPDYDLFEDEVVYRGPGPDNRAVVCPELLRWCRREQRDAVEAIGIPGGLYKFVGTNEPLPEPPPKALPTAELKMTLIGWPTTLVPVSAIRTIQGKVNATDFDTDVETRRWPFSHHPAGTLLATGVEYRHYPSHTGSRVLDFTLNFAVRNNGSLGPGNGVAGWNHLFRHATGRWELVTHNGLAGGRRIYESADYNAAVMPSLG